MRQAIRDTPVMFPPGRAKLGTMPVSTGSPTIIRLGYPVLPASPPARGDVERHDHVDLEPDQLGRELRKSIQLSFRGAKLECNVLPFHIAKFTQSFPKLLLERLRVCGSDVERAYSSHLGLLRARRERPRSGRAANKRDEFAPPHLPPPRLKTRHRSGLNELGKGLTNVRFGSLADIEKFYRIDQKRFPGSTPRLP